MSENPAIKSDDEKAKLREGDSWRAQVFRRKDELLKFSYDRLTGFLTAIPEEEKEAKKIPVVYASLATVHKNLAELIKTPDDEAMGKETIELLEGVAKTLKEAGFEFDSPSA